MTINLILAFIVAAASMQGEETGLIEEFDASMPRTGFVKLLMSPSQVLGPEAAARINHMLLADEMIEWRAYVPRTYSANNPPGVMVFTAILCSLSSIASARLKPSSPNFDAQ